MMNLIKKRVLPLLLAITILLGMMPTAVFATEEPWDGKSIIVNKEIPTGTKIRAFKNNNGDDGETAPIEFTVQDLVIQGDKTIRYAYTTSEKGLDNEQYTFYITPFLATEPSSDESEGKIYAWFKTSANQDLSACIVNVDGVDPIVEFKEKTRYSFNVTVANYPAGKDLSIKASLGIYDKRSDTTKWYYQETKKVENIGEEMGATFSCYTGNAVCYRFEIVSDVYTSDPSPAIFVSADNRGTYKNGEKLTSYALTLKSDYISLPVEFGERVLEVKYNEKVLNSGDIIEINRKTPGTLQVTFDGYFVLKPNFVPEEDQATRAVYEFKKSYNLADYLKNIEQLDKIYIDAVRTACPSELEVSEGGRVILKGIDDKPDREFYAGTNDLLIAADKNRTLIFKADEHWEIEDIEITYTQDDVNETPTKSITDEVGKSEYEFVMEAGKMYTIRVEFQLKKYTVTWSSVGNGTTTVNENAGGTLEVEYNEDISFVLKANDGHRIKALKIDGFDYVDPSTGEVKAWTREDTEYSGRFKVSGNHTIEAEFEPITYEVVLQVNDESMGKAEFSTSDGKIQLYFSYNEGYRLKQIDIESEGKTTTLDGRKAIVDSEKKMWMIDLEQPQSDVNIFVVFEKVQTISLPDNVKNATEGDGNYYAVEYTIDPLRVVLGGTNNEYDYYVLVKSGTKVTFTRKKYDTLELNPGYALNWPWGDYAVSKSFTVTDNEGKFFKKINFATRILGWGDYYEETVETSMVFFTDVTEPNLEMDCKTIYLEKGGVVTFTGSEVDDNISQKQLSSGLDYLELLIYNELTEKYEGGGKQELKFNTPGNSNIITVALPNPEGGYGKYTITAIAYDKAGNPSETKTQTIIISTKEPEVSVTFTPKGNKAPVMDAENKRWYQGMKATVQVTDYCFDKEAMEEALKDVGFRWDGKLSWVTTEKKVHSAEITISEGDYAITKSFFYTNEVGNKTQTIGYYSQAQTEFDTVFSVDGTAPKVTVQIPEVNPWEKLLGYLSFNLFTNVELEIKASVEEENFAVIRYVKLSGEVVKKHGLDKPDESNNKLESWLKFNASRLAWQEVAANEDDSLDFLLSGFTAANEELVVIVAATDKAGNTTYCSTNGMVLDTTKPTVKIHVSTDGEGKNKKFTLSFEVADVLAELPSGENDPPSVERTPTKNDNQTTEEGIASGIKKLSVWVYEVGDTQNPDLYSWSVERLSEATLTFDSKDYSKRDIVVYAIAEDNAGNLSDKNAEGASCRLDTHTPTMSVQSSHKDNFVKEYYQNAEMIVTIEDEKGDFDSTKVQIALADDGKSIVDPESYTVSWTKNTDFSSEVDEQHVGTICFLQDGKYTVTVSYGSCVSETYTFWIDRTAPTAAVKLEKTASETLLNALSFGLLANGNLIASGEISDEIGIEYIGYYVQYAKDSEFKPYTEEELAQQDAQGNSPVEWNPLTVQGNGSYTLEELKKDGFFAVYLKVVDKAGNVTYCCTENTALIDTRKPVVNIWIEGDAWSSFFEFVTFGIFRKEKVEVRASSDEGLSGIAHAEYIVLQHNGGALEADAIVGEWTTIEAWDKAIVTLEAGERYIVYVRVTDKAGNVQIVNSDGIVISNQEPEVKLSPVSVKTERGDDDASIFNASVELKIDIKNSVSGLKQVYLKFGKDAENLGNGTVLYKYDIIGDREKRYVEITDGGTTTRLDAALAPLYDQLADEWHGSYIINLAEKQDEDVYVWVSVEDQAGNVVEESVNVAIDSNPPEVSVRYEDTFLDSEQTGPMEEYYRGDRTMIIEVAERYDHFVTDGVVNAEAKLLVNGEVDEVFATKLKDPDNWPWNGEKFVFTYEFTQDGKYEFVDLSGEENTEGPLYIKITDKATNANSGNILQPNTNSGYFVLDKEPLTVTVTAMENTWGRVIEMLTFGLFSQENVKVVGTADDTTSALRHAYYYIDDGRQDRILNPADIQDWKLLTFAEKEFELGEEFDITDLEPDSVNVVYLKVVDMAGNVSYASTNGIIVDDTAPVVQSGAITVREQKAFYNGPVQMLLSLPIADSTSGIGNITLHIEDAASGEKLHEIELYSCVLEDGLVKISDLLNEDETLRTIVKSAEEAPTYRDLLKEWERRYTLDPEKEGLNRPTKFYLSVTDMAGNTVVGDGEETAVVVDFDLTAPVIEVTYDTMKPVRVENGVGYFAEERTATIRIYERAGHLYNMSADMVKLLKTSYTAVDGEGEPFECEIEIEHNNWDFVENKEDPDKSYYVNTITFPGNANYSLLEVEGYDNAYGFAVSDLNGTQSGEVIYQNKNASDLACHLAFAVDKTEPDGKLIVIDRVWDTFLEIITFGWYKAEQHTLSAQISDITTPIDPNSVYYLITDADVKAGGQGPTQEDVLAMTWTKLEGLDAKAVKGQFEVCQIPEYTHVIYLRFKDYSGNERIISTDGTIVDFAKPTVSITAPNADESFIYNSDVKLTLHAEEPNNAYDSYSGIASMDFYVQFPGSSDWVPHGESANLYTFTYEKAEGQMNPYREQLVQEKTLEVVLNAAEYNYNDLKVKMVATDNAGNVSEFVRTLHIDTTLPQITVAFDNNAAENERYFKEQRTATITVRERNFDPALFSYVTTSSASAAPAIGAWVEVSEGTLNNHRDDRIFRTQIVFSTDSDYTFVRNRCTVTDKAGNACAGAVFAEGTVAGEQFTVDKTNPVIEVSYDNNDAKNESFYKANRTATVTIVERNFREDLVNVALTATNDGERIDLPNVSAWQKSGTTYTATVSFAADGEYTFDISMLDLAGNEAADYNRDSFVIDTVAPELKIDGVENETANSGEVKPGVTYTDLFIDEAATKVSMDGVMRGENALPFTVEAIEKGVMQSFMDVPREKEYDDIYTLTATITDKAGNMTEQVVKFSINRFGSTYDLDEATKSILETYIKEPQDITIYEINPNKLSEIEITIYQNNETITLSEGEDYEILSEGGENQWHKYTYRIFSKNFDVDGTYSVTVHSKDEAGNISENTLDTKNMDIRFGLDRKPPVITMGNLRDGKTYAVDLFTANMMVVDNGKLVEVIVYLDGTEIQKWDAEKLGERSHGDSEFTFDISGDSNRAHRVQVYARDAAGNEQEILVEDFYVTTNLLVRYMNNKPLFYGSIAGFIALIGLVVFLIVRRKKKEEE